MPTALALSITPANTTVLRGATLELNCKTDANPSVHTCQFYLNGNFIGNSSSGVVNVTVEIDGVYTCIPINTVGVGSNASISITAVGEFHCRQIMLTVCCNIVDLFESDKTSTD